LIKIISEFYYVLIESLVYICISLLIFRLEIEITIENILKIYYIKIPINDNILTVIYIYIFLFLYIGGSPVKIYFSIININVLNNIISAVIIKSIIVLPFINSKIFKVCARLAIEFSITTKTFNFLFTDYINKSSRSFSHISEVRLGC
jgi:hypothetical protein